MLKAVPRVFGLAVVCLIAAGCASSAVRFPNATPATPKEVPAELYTPSGTGPFPAVVLLHGCHGVSASTRQWARWFKERSYVALVVDSWAARGIREDCSPTSADLPNTERFDDAVGALRFLHSRSDVDRDHVGVIGWSNGGAFALALVNGPSHERARQRGVVMPEPGYRAAVGVYPGGCPSLIGQLAVRPLLVLIGASDDWTAAGPCVQMAESMRQRGADVSVVLYPGAFHYFDVEGQARTFLSDVVKDERTGALGATVAYDFLADADAHRRVAEFFGYHLRRQSSMAPARLEPRAASDGHAERRYRSLPLGLNRGWRAIGTWSSVDARGERSMDLGLRGKVALVTAASKGMGKACAMGFATEGARVAVCARTEADIKTAAEEVRVKTGAEVLAMAADVTRADDVKSIVARTKQTFGGIDVLVANCGGPPRGELHQMTDEQWYGAFEVSLLSVVRLVREVAPIMRARKWGRILTIQSVSVKQPVDGLLLSNAIRPGVAGLSKTLAPELGKDNITINVVCPGRIMTDRFLGGAKQAGMPVDEYVARSAKDVPLGRIGTPEEFANVVVFLASERASYVTGVVIQVDGGMVRGIV